MRFYLALTLLLVGCGGTNAVARTSPDTTFAEAADAFYWRYMELAPTTAVELGYHQYDGRLPDASTEALQKEVAWLRQSQRTLESYAPDELSERERVEREVLLTSISGVLFGLDVTRDPWRNPMAYQGALGLTSYISRDYAPIEDRARGIVQIANGTEAYLKQARENLEERIPRTWLQIALLQIRGLAEFVDKGGDVRKAMGGLGGDDRKALNAALDAMEASLRTHEEYLVSLEPQVTDDYALGEERFLQMLRETQGLDTDIATLERIAAQDLARNLKALEAAARAIDPRRSTRDVVQRVMSKKPRAARVLPEARAQAVQTRKFVLEHEIATIPSEDVAEVRVTPPFLRWNFAFLDAAGPFETKPLPGFYYISPPDPSWPKAKRQGYLPATVDLYYVTVHELWPGHFLQLLHQKTNPSKVLKSFWNYAMGEGWAHYTEEMMWNAGVAKGDEQNHIGQLLNALLRNVRFVSAIGLHAKGMTVEESEKLFIDKAFQDEANASQQAVRGTFDPMYLSYTVGKLMILKLRQDWKAKVGSAYSLKAFHDRFLSHGAAPVPVIREAMLGPESGPAL